ncbi:response regulator [Roseovarius salis]|uniref:response regulator n=1 Tax=Roseovarius salis TaxID=3376063 RepID=UPI0037C69F05
MDDLKDCMIYKTPTATRPLLGMTILVVEDSRFACEALRLMCLRSGARIRRADCLASARRHLKVYRPSAVIVDMGLPDGPGAELISDLAGAMPRIGVILGMSGDDGTEDAALSAGADGFLGKPLTTLAGFQQAVIAALPDDQKPDGPRSVATDTVTPEWSAYRDDIAHIANLLETRQDGATLDYAAQFLRGVALAARDCPLENAATDLAESRAVGRLTHDMTTRLIRLLRARTASRAAI